MKILFIKGLPGSGKTTWAKQFCEKNTDWIRVSRDDLRNMRGKYWIPKQEGLITKMENLSIESALESGFNVLLDATNLSKDRNKHKFNELKKKFPDLQMETKFFDVSVDECIKRDLARPNSVGQKVIRGMFDKHLAPKVDKVVLKQDTSLPKAVIVDIDGTLAKMVDRGPFDWLKVDTDIVKEPIKEIVQMLHASGKRIIIFTGRDGVCKDLSAKWLRDNDIPFDDIFTRPERNFEKDSIIKKRLFDDHVKDKFHVDFVLDDRTQVVKMWRDELGLTCLQVDWGDF